MFNKRKPSVVKGVFAGVAAGLIATLAMDQFQSLLAKSKKAAEKKKKLAEGESPWLVANELAQEEIQAQHAEGSTVKVAAAIADATGTTIPKARRQQAGQAVHYTFGTLMGVVYSATAELLPELTTGGGTAFGTLLFLGADEVAVPAFQLGPPPTDVAATDHLQYWAAHIVYGGTLELARNVLRRLL
jgi:uncharacterized membrane protein YagU involved in acid resistance